MHKPLILFLLLVTCWFTGLGQTNIYVAKNLNNLNDYIELTFDDKIPTGVYYGASIDYKHDTIYYKASIVQVELINNEIEFELKNFKFSKRQILPSSTDIEFLSKETVVNKYFRFWGKIDNDTLVLKGTKMYYYSRFDNFTFAKIN